MIAWAKRWAIRAALVLGAVALAGGVIVVSGVVPVKASSGHWAITAWALHFALQRSVATHTALAEPPDTAAPWKVELGAGHYEGGCRPCHGAPGQPMPRIPAAMTPHPPRLEHVVSAYDAEELFYIVQHGVKFTGMPGWPSPHRDDEVEAVVAFLLAMPGMDGARYHELVHGPAAPSPVDDPVGAAVPVGAMPAPAPEHPASARPCVRCHGRDGMGRGSPAFPRLAGQSEAYLVAALEAYARGRRHSGIMEPIAAPLDEATWRELARHYARLGADDDRTRASGEGGEETRDQPGDERTRRGAAIAQDGLPERGVPSCVSCHGPGDGPRNPSYPRLGGQSEEYLVGQLRLFAQRRRGGSPYAPIMELVAARLTDEQVRDVAAHYAAVGPAGGRLR